MMVADSHVLIDFLEGRAPAANRVSLELDRGQLRTTVIRRFELLAGAKTTRQLKLVGELLASLPCLPLDEPGADAAAEIRRTLERDGVGIGMADSLIAGIVVAHHGVLLTRNRRHHGQNRTVDATSSCIRPSPPTSRRGFKGHSVVISFGHG